jgi:hypothetical protein
MMGRGGKKLGFRMIVATTALTLISSCVMQKNSFATSRNPLFDKQNVLLYDEWKKGSCSADPETGIISYAGKNGSNSLELSEHHFKNAIAIHCFDEKTVLVKEDEIIIVNEGAKAKKSPYAEKFKEEYNAVEDTVVDYENIKNSQDEVNLASAAMGSDVFVLGKNTETGDFFIDKTDIRNAETDTYELGKLFKGNVDMIAYKGIVFMAGEADKGKNYLFAFRPGEKLKIFPFSSKENLKGSVELWIEHSIADSSEVKEGSLILDIGKKQFRIDVEPKKSLPKNIKISK